MHADYLIISEAIPPTNSEYPVMSDFGALSDDALLHVPEPSHASTSHTLEESHLLFQYDRYDWTNFKPDYCVIMLTQGYFAIVHPRDADRAMQHKWRANVQLDKESGKVVKVYALSSGGVVNGKREFTYLHRFIKNAGKGDIVDHIHGLSLDCRNDALKITDHFGNNGNSRSGGRRTHTGLLQGVELRRRKTRYGGQIKFNGKTYRSKKCWKMTPQGELAAHTWYLNRHKEFYRHRGLPENGGVANYPVFPPLKKSVAETQGVLLTETF